MPSGATHDRITFFSLPFISAASWLINPNADSTLVLAGSFLFSGLMFGPDLDIYSVQYKRWGFLRWIWHPYQNMLSHRSWISHGPLVGTLVRLIYLGTWILVGATLYSAIAIATNWPLWEWQTVKHHLFQGIIQYQRYIVASLVGLELGALSHSASDWIGSTWKRRQSRTRSKRRRRS